MLNKVSLITISKWVMKLSFFDLCQLAVVVPCLSLYLCWAFELLRRPVVGGIRCPTVGVGPGPSPWVCMVLHSH